MVGNAKRGTGVRKRKAGVKFRLDRDMNERKTG